MARSKVTAAILTTALALGGCSFASDALFPSLSGSDPAGEDQAVETKAASAAPAPAGRAAVTAAPTSAAPPMGSASFESPGVTPGQSTGTHVGQKAGQMRGELGQLQTTMTSLNGQLQQVRAQTVQDSQLYHGTLSAINSRLQVGTTPGNPILLQQWNAASVELDKINDDIARMNALANETSQAATLAAYLLDSVRATRGLSGAVDEDHRQLTVLEDETNRTVVLVERVLTELSQDITRQQAYLGNERSNLNLLAIAVKNGQFYGTSLANRSSIPQVSVPMADAAPMAGGKPLMVIKFDRQNVAYEQQLYTAVSRALERKPNATFDLVAISPAVGTVSQPALSASMSKKDAEQVMRSLNNMGLPSTRVRMSASSSSAATSPEVHLFVH
ncbi:MAG: hypothetical protein OEL53_06240 [Rhodospirillales bacterium]|nr:hypothetical protein [Rhodospirillales bacterium]